MTNSRNSLIIAPVEKNMKQFLTYLKILTSVEEINML